MSEHPPDPVTEPARLAATGGERLGALDPLREPVFRMLWLASLGASTCLWMNDVAAAWLMTSLTTSPAMVALVSSCSTLPMFFFGLPSGALADILDRRRYLMWTQFWVAGVALVSAFTVLTDLMTAPLLLLLTFMNGLGLAMRLPLFAALVPELLPRSQLPAGLALNGVSMNTSRIIGPILAGMLISSLGLVWVFVLNSALSVGIGLAVLRWKYAPRSSALPGERFLGAIRVGVQYVKQSPRMHIVLARVSVFFVQSSGLMALLPLIARQMPGGQAGTFTVLLASMGAGAILSALLMPRLRERATPDQVVLYGTLLQASMALVVVWAPNVFVAVPAMVVAGMSWLSVANSLSVSAQLALPNWVRARAMSIYQMALMGSSAIGAAFWGQVANATGVLTSVELASTFGLTMLLVMRRLHVDNTLVEDLTPMRPWNPPVTSGPIDPEAGPVLVTIEYRIDPTRLDAFRDVMQRSRRWRLQHGAVGWELFRDSTDPTRYIEYFIDETWTEHLRRFDRLTAADVAMREARLAFHVGDAPPVVSRYIADQLQHVD